MRQLLLPLGPAPQPSLDNFVVGANAAALRALKDGPRVGAPIYMWGPAGVGKSHLLRAAARAHGAGPRVFDPASPLPWLVDESCPVAAIDGCEALDVERQHAAFALFVQPLAVLAAGRLPPVDLPLREDLRTRLGGGLVFQLHPPSEHEVRVALEDEAGRRGLRVPGEVIGFLLTRFERDLGTLMRWLDALDAYSLREQRPVTVPLVKRLLAEEGVPPGKDLFSSEPAP